MVVDKKNLPPYQSDTHIHSYTHTHTPFALGVHHYMPQIGNPTFIVFISGFITKVPKVVKSATLQVR